MSFFLSPIKFVFELIGFLLSAAFVYGLALIAAITIIVYGISTSPVNKYTNPKIVETVVEKVEKKPELVCERITGCEVFPNALTEEEYCPTCVMR
tara:strand:+ start:87 stop:371 length:285 start_codon:yes stop_codon:yes gene_type:complete